MILNLKKIRNDRLSIVLSCFLFDFLVDWWKDWKKKKKKIKKAMTLISVNFLAGKKRAER